MTAPDESFAGDETENQLYVSLWQDHDTPVVSLLCRGPCLPNVRKSYSDQAESYRSQRATRIAPSVWEATMRADGTAGTDFTVRLDVRAPSISFDGRDLELRRVTFQLAGYHLMSGFGEREAMLFTDGRDILIKPAPPTSGGTDDTFLYLAADDPRVHAVQARNWRYRLEPAPNADEPGTHFAVLRGEILLPQGPATLELDVVRSPVSDVGLSILRAGQPKLRFTQSNDSNTSRYQSCAGRPAKCQVLWIARSVAWQTCTSRPGGLAVVIDPAGSWRAFTLDDKNHALDRDCKSAYTLEQIGETKVVLKDATGKVLELAK
jgi:hypothetical protein